VQCGVHRSDYRRDAQRTGGAPPAPLADGAAGAVVAAWLSADTMFEISAIANIRKTNRA
jgi:hypothetical protein